MNHLQELRYDGSDDDELFYSAEEPSQGFGDIDDSDSFYSADDRNSNEDIESVARLSLVPDLEQDGNNTYLPFEGSQEGIDHTMHGCDGVGSSTIRLGTAENDTRDSSSFGIYNGQTYIRLTTGTPPEAENPLLESRTSDALTFDIQSDSDLEIYSEKRKDRQNRSPSVRIMRCEDSSRANEFNSRPKFEEITVPDFISLAADPVVEFDGTKQVIVVQSDDEDILERPFSRKREKTPETLNLAENELQQSPYQRKMRKLKQIADRANGLSSKMDGAASRVMEP